MMRKVKFLKHAAVAILLMLGIHAPPEASAGLKDRAAVNATTGFPMWYRDASTAFTNGLPLELCLSNTPSPVAPASPMCVLLPDATYAGGAVGNPGGNFPGESFYFIADGDFTAADPAGLYKLVYRAALEATYATGIPVPGTEMVFMRIRIRMDNLTPGAVYTITHPYGVKQLTAQPDPKVPTLGTINYTEDLLPPAAPQFDGPIFGNVIPPGFTIDVSPFLQAATPLPPNPTTGEQFIGDPNVSTTVTGSPFGTNFVTVEGPGVLITTNLFQVAGKIATLGKITPPAVTAFGTAQAGTTSAPKTVQITNTAQRAGQLFGINSISFTGATTDFALATSATTPCPAVPFTLDAGQSCNIDVVFTPTAPAGAKTATLTVNTTDPTTAVKTATFTGTATTVTASMTASLPTPQIAGPAITFTATGTGTPGPFQYRFWLKTGTTWSVVQDYGTKNTWVWNTAGLASGLYSVQADVRTVGSTAQREAQANSLYRLNIPAAANGVTLAPAPATPSPQPSGSLVTFNAQGSGGSGVYEYRFWLKSGGVWTEMQPYSRAASWTWNTGGMAPGSYAVQVDVRNAGSTVRSQAVRAVSYSLSTPVAVSANLVPSVKTQTAGLPVTFTATAVGGTGPYQYRFWLKSGTTWSEAQPYGTSPVLTWTAATPGTYAVQVDVRAAGTTVGKDAARAIPFTVQ